MRQGQQNRRGRGRNHNNNNNRKGQNPLTRSYESSGPDVKLRGTPAHIAEKYISLARDAQSSGDHVLAENYLQHAEHYNRIILAFREQHMQNQGGEAQGGVPRPSFGPEAAEGDEFGEGEGEEATVEGIAGLPPRGQEPQPQIGEGSQPPRHEGRPEFGREGRDHQQRQRHGRPDNRHQQGHQGHQHGGHRQQRDQFGEPRDQHQGDRRPRHERNFDRPQPEMSTAGPVGEGVPGGSASGQFQQRRRDRFPPQTSGLGGEEQPDFLRRSVRRPRRDLANGNGEEHAEAPVDPDKPQD